VARGAAPAGGGSATPANPASQPAGVTSQPVTQPLTAPPVSVSTGGATVPKPTVPATTVTVDPAAEAAAAAAAADRAEAARIRESVDTFVRGIATRQIDLLRRAWPSMPADNRRGYEAMFKDASDLSAQLIGTPEVVVRGNAGDASFTVEMKGQSSARGAFSVRTQYRAKLQRTDQGWIFATLQSAAG
jgi:hypothetical protein